MGYEQTLEKVILRLDREEKEKDRRIAELEKENEWLFDFALGYTNAPFLVECLEELKETK